MARDPSGDPLVREMRRIQPLAARLRDVADDEDALEALLEYERFPPKQVGSQPALYARTDHVSQRVVLSQTRRTVKPVIQWVNAYFSHEMHHDPGVQAAYEPLAARPHIDGVDLAEAELGVRLVGDVVDGSAGARWEAEADAIARVSRLVVGEGWPVSARDGGRWFTRRALFGHLPAAAWTD